MTMLMTFIFDSVAVAAAAAAAVAVDDDDDVYRVAKFLMSTWYICNKKCLLCCNNKNLVYNALTHNFR